MFSCTKLVRRFIFSYSLLPLYKKSFAYYVVSTTITNDLSELDFVTVERIQTKKFSFFIQKVNPN